MDKKTLYIILGVVAAVVVIVIGVGIYLWNKTSSPKKPCGSVYPPSGADLRDNFRLMGQPAGGGTGGENANSAQECYQYCDCAADPDASGFAFWKNGKKCWCAKAPFNNQAWVPDSEWYSGTFTKTS